MVHASPHFDALGFCPGLSLRADTLRLTGAIASMGHCSIALCL
jgi:hypothetical protein